MSPTALPTSGAGSRIAYVGPAWFAVVMGLSGLALAWHRATPLLGASAEGVAVALGGLAAAVFVLLCGLSLWRLQRHPRAWPEDLRHPVRHPFVAALPVSLILLATLSVALRGPDALGRVLWWAGSVAQLGTTLWVLARWWRPKPAGGLAWPAVTPLLLIPIVGNVLVPLAGVPLGHAPWAAAQFAIGALFWPVILALLAVRVAVAGPWPERLLPSVFILVAPPAVIGLGLASFGAPDLMVWGLWGLAGFSALWAASHGKAIAAQAFGLPHWALSFPLAALATLTLRMQDSGGPMPVVVATAGLALASLVVAALVLGTLRGLRDGSLLAPEPVATVTVAPAGAGAG